MFYSENKENLDPDLSNKLRKSIESLKQYCGHPDDLATPIHDMFGQKLDAKDPVLSALKGPGNVDSAAVKSVTNACLTVCMRQLADYLDVNHFTDEHRKLAKSAPSHNMQSERVMAMCDSQTHRAPNAKVDFLEAKIKAKTNKSLTWLDSKSPEEQELLVKYARSRLRAVSAQKNAQQAEIAQEIINRMQKKLRTKNAADRRKMEKRVAELGAQGHVTGEQTQELCPQVPAQELEAALTLFNKPAEIVGSVILHTWFDEGQVKDVVPTAIKGMTRRNL